MKTLKNKAYKTLRWSEKYTKTDMVYLANGGFWLSVGNFIVSISSFFLAIAFANILPKEDFGTYKYVLSIIGILSITTLTGMATAVAQSIARDKDGSVKKAISTKIKFGTIGSLVSVLTSLYYFYNNNIVLSLCFLIAALFIPLSNSFAIYKAILDGKKKFKKSSIYKTSSDLLSWAIIITTLFATKNIVVVLFVYLLSTIFIKLFIFKYATKNEKAAEETDPDVINYGKHLSVANILESISGKIDKILIWHYLGAAELAIYAVAISPPDQIKGIVKQIRALALPKFSASSREQIKKGIFKKILILTLFITLVTISYVLLAEYIFDLFFPQYMESVFYSKVYAISILATSSSLIVAAMNAKKAKKQIYQFNVISPLIRMTTLFIFIQYFGLLGAISAKVINRFLNFIILSVLIKRI